MLVAALLDAFETRASLTQMALLGLHLNLPHVAEGDNLTEAVVQLVTWAEENSRLADLLTAATAANPSNVQLQTLVNGELGLALWQALDQAYSTPPACPYPGMRAFKAIDTRFFYGREDEIDELLARLRTEHFQLVIGPSGSGKSSLLVAGLLPKLPTYSYWPAQSWHVILMMPGAAPNEELRRRLRGEQGMAALDALALDALLAEAGAQRLLLVVDQLEQLFAQADRGEQTTFLTTIDQLCKLERCTVVAAMRADFYPDLMASQLWPLAYPRRLEIAPLAGERLRHAIVKPAEAVAVKIEPALVERLLADAADAPGSLPMLQETLSLLWPRMSRRLLPASAYESMGEGGRSGMAVAIARKADSTFADLSKEQQVIARRIFLRLVQFAEDRLDTGRRQPVVALRAARDDPQLFAATLEALTASRLLVLSGEGKPAVERTADIAHDTLIRNWPALQTWIRERGTAEHTRRWLEDKAAEWERFARKGGLLDEAELAEAERWLDQPDALEVGYSGQLKDLVDASRQQARRNAALRAGFTVGLALLVLVAFAAAGFAFSQYNLANAHLAKIQSANATAVAERDRAAQQTLVAGSRALAFQAIEGMDQSPSLSLLLAAEAYAAATTFEARESLLRTLQYNPPLADFLRSHSNAVSSVAFSPDGNMLASGSWDKTIILWDLLSRTPSGSPLTGHGGPVTSVAFSPDGNMLASGSWDKTIILWDVTRRTPIGSPLSGHSDYVTSVAFSPDGNTLASGSFDRTIILWDVSRRTPIGSPLTGHGGPVTSVAFRPDGDTLASGSFSPTNCIILWDVDTRTRISTSLPVWDLPVSQVVFSRDGETLAWASAGSTPSSADYGGINLWNVDGDARISSTLTALGDAVKSLAFNLDGTIIASAFARNTAFSTVKMWNVPDGSPIGSPLAGHSDTVNSLAFSPDGTILASGSDDHTIILWEVVAGNLISSTLTAAGEPANSVAFSPDGNTLASARSDKTIILWDVSSRTPSGSPLTGHGGPVTSVAFRPDGNTLASASSDKTIILWDLVSRTPSGSPLTGHGDYVSSVAFSPNGNTLASGGNDDSIILWDVATRTAIGAPLSGHRDDVLSVAFSPDGNMLASGSADKTIILWDAVRRIPIGSPLTGYSDGVTSLVFSPDGKTLAAASRLLGINRTFGARARPPSGNIILWDVSRRTPIGSPLTGHADYVSSVAFSRDGNTLASGGNDDSIILWDVATRTAIGAPLSGHRDDVLSVAFSPDGNKLASGSLDEAILLWDVSAEGWQTKACRRANRKLSKPEWDRYIGTDREYRPTCTS